MKLPKHCTRLDDNTLCVNAGVPNRIYANAEVPIEDGAVEELKELLQTQVTADQMYAADPSAFSQQPSITQVNLSPDFHKGAGIPIGTTLVTRGMIVPQAVGGDINCGVRVITTNLQRKDVEERLDELEPVLRRIYFEGGRNIPFSQQQRQNIITSGLCHLRKETDEGIWQYWSDSQHTGDLSRVRHGGGFDTDGRSYGLSDYLDREGVSRDSQIGSIGGGNHFVELQYVDKVHDSGTAYQMGLRRNQLIIMVHSGSVSVGYLCGGLYKTLVREIYQRFGLKYPKNEIFPLPDNLPEFDRFWVMLHNAANFAFANRTFLGLMMLQALNAVFGETSGQLLYDTPHNLVWPADSSGDYVHRKGTSPADDNEPVLIPGSMGAASFIMRGQGNHDALCSASHGAGRSLSRGNALKHDERAFEAFLQRFRIVTPIDPNRSDIRKRKDIVKQWHDSLKKEAPFAYKNVYPVVNTLKDAGIAQPVVEVQPLLTVKGQ